MTASMRATRTGATFGALLLAGLTPVPAPAHTVTVKLFRTGTMDGGQAEWVSGVQVALRAENYTDASYLDTDWDGEQTLTIPDDAVNPYFQWYKIDCPSGSALYDTTHQGVVYIPIDCPQHRLTIDVYDEESWNGRTGRLMPGVSVRVDSPRYPYYFRTLSLQTDDNGRAELWLPRGDYQIELSRNDCRATTTMIRNVTADRVEPLFINCPDSTDTSLRLEGAANDVVVPGHR